MRIFWVLLRRELASYFLSLTGYVIIAAITFLTGESFVQLVDALGTDPWPMPVTQMFFGSFYFWMIVLLSAPVITMRLFALEKASGTFETLMTTAVGDFEAVPGQVLPRAFILSGGASCGCRCWPVLFVVGHDLPATSLARWITGCMVGGMCIWASSWRARFFFPLAALASHR